MRLDFPVDCGAAPTPLWACRWETLHGGIDRQRTVQRRRCPTGTGDRGPGSSGSGDHVRASGGGFGGICRIGEGSNAKTTERPETALLGPLFEFHFGEI